MELLEKMNAALYYIESMLDDEIDNKQLSNIANCSFYHFQKLFSTLTSISLSEYIRTRRLDRAAFDLQNSDMHIFEIAIKYGYDSPTAFNRAHNIAPSKLRTKSGVALKAFPPISFNLSIKGATIMNYKIIHINSFRLVGFKLTVSTECAYQSIPLFWKENFNNGNFQRLIEVNEKGLNNSSKINGVLGLSETSDLENYDSFNYYIATASNKNVPNEMLEIIIPSCTYAVFECKGIIPNAMQDMIKRVYGEWLPVSGYEWANAPDIERYSDGNPLSESFLSEIWLPIKLKQKENENVPLANEG